MSIEISAEEFRKSLAGHKGNETEGEVATYAIRNECVNFLAIMPSLFGDDLDRKTMWDRIASGIKTSIAKANDDLEEFVSYLLEHIKAEPAYVAANEKLSAFISIARERDAQWRSLFMHTLEKKLFVLLVLSREKWNEYKKMNSKGETK